MAAEKAARPTRRGQPGLPRIAWLLAGGSFVNCLGNFVVAFLVPYLLHRGYGTGLAAGAVSAYAAGKIAAGLAGGLLTDRFGARVTTAGSMAGSAAATLALAAVSGPALILATAALTGLISELYRPATSAILAAEVPGRQRVRAFGVYQLGVSAGTAAGTAIGGLVAEHSFLILFAGDAATSLAWAIGAWRVLPRTRTAPPPALPRPQPQSPRPGILRDRQLARLLAVTVLVNLILFQAQITLPLWIHRQGLPTSSYGLLLALNSGLLMVLQLPATRLTARWRPQPVIAAASVLIGAGFGLLTLAHTSMLLAVTVTIFSLGELAQWPVAAAYTTSLAPPGMTGRYAGTRSLCYGTALLLAPLAGTALYSLSPALLWAGCAAAGICAAAIIAPAPTLTRPARRLPGRTPDAHVPSANSVTSTGRPRQALTGSSCTGGPARELCRPPRPGRPAPIRECGSGNRGPARDDLIDLLEGQSHRLSQRLSPKPAHPVTEAPVLRRSGMRIVDIRERPIAISRYRDPGIPSGGLTTSLVAVVTDVIRSGRPVVGYGFASIGRYAQSGLIRDRFAPRLLRAEATEISTDNGANLDPFRAWSVMMTGEKPGGHGERCVAVGTLDMALWDIAAKIADLPLHRFLAGRLDRNVAAGHVPVYASGGYPYPDNDIAALSGEIQHFADLGFDHVKIKIGGAPLDHDLRRIEAAAARLADSDHLAVDAMNAYDPAMALTAATALARFRLWWFEDICDPLDFGTHARIAARYDPPIAAGEALFSAAEAALLGRYGGLRPDRDILLFDPVHCYGLPGYLEIINRLTAAGWPRHAFWPHGGHLFSLHIVAALGLGGAEINPLAFHPFHGPPPALPVTAGRIPLPDVPGIGFELHDQAWQAFRSLTTPPG